jgi:hypothetical protein
LGTSLDFTAFLPAVVVWSRDQVENLNLLISLLPVQQQILGIMITMDINASIKAVIEISELPPLYFEPES